MAVKLIQEDNTHEFQGNPMEVDPIQQFNSLEIQLDFYPLRHKKIDKDQKGIIANQDSSQLVENTSLGKK